MLGQLFRRLLIIVVFFGELQVLQARSDAAHLAARWRRVGELIEAVELKMRRNYILVYRTRQFCDSDGIFRVNVSATM